MDPSRENAAQHLMACVVGEINRKLSNRANVLSECQVWSIVWSKILGAMLEGGTLPKNSYETLRIIVNKYLQDTHQRAHSLARPKFLEVDQILSSTSYKLFHRQLRSEVYPYNSVAVVFIRFYSDTKYWFEQINDPKVHAEDIALYRIRRMRQERKNFKDPLMEVVMFSSWSPCLSCADKIIEFVSETNVENFSIRFTSVYKAYDEASTESLQKLAHFYAGNISVGVLQEEDWRTLSIMAS